MPDEAANGPGRTDAVRVLVGSLVAASRGHAPAAREGTEESASPDLRYVALGALCVAEDGLLSLARVGVRAARAVGRPVAAVASPVVPGFVRRDVARTVRGLDEYGRSAAAAGSGEARDIVSTLADDVVQDPTILHIVEQIIQRVQWRVVDEILPVVLARLTAEPEQVRALVQGQSRGMVEDLTNTARTRAAEGDETVDRLLTRVLHRRARAARIADRGPEPPPTVLPSGT